MSLVSWRSILKKTSNKMNSVLLDSFYELCSQKTIRYSESCSMKISWIIKIQNLLLNWFHLLFAEIGAMNFRSKYAQNNSTKYRERPLSSSLLRIAWKRFSVREKEALTFVRVGKGRVSFQNRASRFRTHFSYWSYLEICPWSLGRSKVIINSVKLTMLSTVIYKINHW